MNKNYFRGQMVRLLVLTLLAVSFATGCTRPMDDSAFSSITIKVPNGLGTLSAMPADRKACYGVNVTGPNIPTKKGNSCSPVTGVIGGYAEPGATVEAQVPKGKARKIELLAYLLPSGSTAPCPTLGTAMTPTHLLSRRRRFHNLEGWIFHGSRDGSKQCYDLQILQVRG